MAFQTRSRDPLLDSTMQAAIEKRGKELIGVLLIGLGLMVALMIGSYSADDPNWMVSTDAPVQNFLGRTGASVAFILITLFGKASWAIALFLTIWGGRCVLHRGEDRFLWPLLLSLPWLLLVSLHLETLVPSEAWKSAHTFGLGGMIGYTFLGMLLALLPVGLIFLVKFLSLLTALGMVSLGATVLGFTRPEVTRGLRFILVGLILIYGAIAGLLGRGAASGMQAALSYRSRRAERTAAAVAMADVVDSAETDPQMFEPMDFGDAHMAAPPLGAPSLGPAAAPHARVEPAFEASQEEIPEPVKEKTGLFARVPSLIRRADPVMPEPELVEPVLSDMSAAADLDDLPGDERIAEKIASAVRVRRAADVAPEVDFPLTKGRGRRPEPLIFNPNQAIDGLPPEPPLTGASLDAMGAALGATPSLPPAPETGFSADIDPHRGYDEAAYDHPAVASSELQHDTSPEFVDHVASEDLPNAPAVTSGAAQVLRRAPQSAQAVADTPATAAPVTPPVTLPVAEPRRAVVEQPVRKQPQPSTRAKAEAQPPLAFEDTSSDFELPPLSLLTSPAQIERHHLSDEALEENARMLESVLDDYGVKGDIVSVRPGPVVTMYELEPAPGLKASRVIGLADDIARSMSALSARVSTVPGRTVIGIELPNDKREKVVLREILASRDFGDGTHALPLALGKDIGGDSMVANLAKMPHLLIAGTTGSGKSVAINTMILSLLYKLTPDECRLIMIDPKMLELSVYDGIPHLLSPVVTDPKKAVVALKWVVGEMEDRYRKMSKMGVRNIAGFNGRVKEALSKGEMFSRTVQTGFDDDTGEPVFETEEFAPEALPYIVVIVDEMADLMMVAGKEIEACIQRLAQMARASGIHLIMATQRPSVDVITGTIKANFPTRISFQVTSKVDSRTILGEMGAEQLLGMGDMLYMAGGAKITRCHGPFVSDEEVEEVVNHLKQFGPPEYIGNVLDGPDDEKADNIDAVLGLSTGGNTDTEDALYDTAVQIVIKDRKCSTSYIQRKLAIGYNKAARLVEQMEEEGLVSPANHVGKREILVPEQ
ncbi:DNA translocase FtsK [Phaeobacter inhibens]|uniref:DNA translocase FtsK 4TM domain-containing protein n=1 Tax=Phaeobacter inhibens TaxID=221822 RepID=UPI00274CA4E7|nr:DNA translocase FtsK 4TM domain-containing protein [Phaeobacter inhibens]GLO71991.1 DNA translocase FtsK [Phaeobacter inhibens]